MNKFTDSLQKYPITTSSGNADSACKTVFPGCVQILQPGLKARSALALTPGEIRPGIDCMLENMPPCLINRLMKFH